VLAIIEHNSSYSLRKRFIFDETAGARVVPASRCNSSALQNVGSISQGSVLTYSVKTQCTPNFSRILGHDREAWNSKNVRIAPLAV
jgi:hypothetical protein